MKRRIWPDIVIVIAVLAIGFGGAWALWGQAWFKEGRAKQPPVETAVPVT